MTSINSNDGNNQDDTFNNDNNNNNMNLNWILEEILHILYTSIGGFRYGIKIRTPHAILMTLLFKQQLSLYDKLLTIYNLTKEHTINLTKFATFYKLLLFVFKFWSRRKRQQHQNTTHLQRRTVRFQDDTLSNASTSSSSPTNSTTTTTTTTTIRSSISPFLLSPRGGVSSLFPNTNNNNNNNNKVGIGYAENSFHAFIAGTISGYIVWGNYTSINYQIVLYLFSRISVAVVYRLRLYLQDIYRNKQQQQQQQHDTNNTNTNTNSLSNLSNSPLVYSTCAALIWGIVMMLYEDTPYVLHPSLKSSMDEIYRFQLLLFPSSNEEKSNNQNQKQTQTKI